MSNNLKERVPRVLKSLDEGRYEAALSYVRQQEGVDFHAWQLGEYLRTQSEMELAEFMRIFDPDSRLMVTLMSDEAHGVFMWQHLASVGNLKAWNVPDEDIEWLQDTDPNEEEFYWEKVEEIMDKAYMEGRSGNWKLVEDGGIWAVHPCFNLEHWV